jgi:hypothetical protein
VNSAFDILGILSPFRPFAAVVTTLPAGTFPTWMAVLVEDLETDADPDSAEIVVEDL